MRAFACVDDGVYLVHLGAHVCAAVDVLRELWAPVEMGKTMDARPIVELEDSVRLLPHFARILNYNGRRRTFFELGNPTHGEGGRFATADGGTTNERYYITQEGDQHHVHDRKWEQKGDPYIRTFGSKKEAKAKMSELKAKYGHEKPAPVKTAKPTPDARAVPAAVQKETESERIDRRAADARAKFNRAIRDQRAMADVRKKAELEAAAPKPRWVPTSGPGAPIAAQRQSTAWKATTAPYAGKTVAEQIAINNQRALEAMKSAGITPPSPGKASSSITPKQMKKLQTRMSALQTQFKRKKK